MNLHHTACQRPYSIRTRIKTNQRLLTDGVAAQVRDHIPLEQGLRPMYEAIDDYIGTVRDHIPLEQGLRRSSAAFMSSASGQRPYSIRTRIKT